MVNLPIRVLIPSGAGAPGFAGIVKCLKQRNLCEIYAGDCEAGVYGSSLADYFFVVPKSNHPDYIHSIAKICIENKIDVVLPITTQELILLAKNEAEFQKIGVKVIISDLDNLTIANNKGLLHQFSQSIDIPIPEGEVTSNKIQWETTVDNLQKRHEILCFKPVLGNGSRGFGIISKEVNHQFLTNKPSTFSLLKEEWNLRLQENFEIPLLVTEFLPGTEYSVDLVCRDGAVLICIPRTRDKMIGGISVAGKIIEDTDIINQSKKLAESLKLNGPIGMQWRRDRNGIAKLLEINPRLQGTTSSILLAGVNIPLISVLLALNRDAELEKLDFIPVWNTKFTRFWEDIKVLN